MLFSSPIFLFAFLPFAFIGYFFLNHLKLVVAAKYWLVIASFAFYGYWNPIYIPLLIASIGSNFWVGSILLKARDGASDVRKKYKGLLIFGILLNIGLLGYYKYSDFFLSSVNWLSDSNYPLLNLVLPLAISFFTFQQIAFIVDAYRGRVKDNPNLLNYTLFVTFFPQLIAGPIVHHREMMPQFQRLRNTFINWNNIIMGSALFFLGLFKKLCIADPFGRFSDPIFDSGEIVTFLEGWSGAYSFIFQVYYDFSAYADMAIGVALLFNIRLPINFHSPYKACNLSELWQRWNITLSIWLRDYVFFALPGSRRRSIRLYINLMILFFVSGLWHGASWTFVIWGLMNGLGICIHRLWREMGFKMHAIWGGIITFNYFVFAGVLFRSSNFENAIQMYKGMLGLNGWGGQWLDVLMQEGLKGVKLISLLHIPEIFVYLIVVGIITFFMPNSSELVRYTSYQGFFRVQSRALSAIILGIIAGVALSFMMMSESKVFIYFNF